MATQADGHAERDAALLMLRKRQKDSSRRITVGADKACDAKNFIAGARALNVTEHVQKNEKGRRSNVDRRTTRHAGYATSLSRRWLIEKTFGWLKQTGPLAQVRLRGLANKVVRSDLKSVESFPSFWGSSRTVRRSAMTGLALLSVVAGSATGQSA